MQIRMWMNLFATKHTRSRLTGLDKAHVGGNLQRTLAKVSVHVYKQSMGVCACLDVWWLARMGEYVCACISTCAYRSCEDLDFSECSKAMRFPPFEINAYQAAENRAYSWR